MKPWKSEPRAAQLEAFLGAYGMRTSEIKSTEELIRTAARVYEVPPAGSVAEMAEVIAAIPKKQRRLLARKNIGVRQKPSDLEKQADEILRKADCTSSSDPEKLLRQVVGAVIGAGQGHLLNELPDVLAFFGGRIPTVRDVIGADAKIRLVEGGITLDDRVYRFTCARQVSTVAPSGEQTVQ